MITNWNSTVKYDRCPEKGPSSSWASVSVAENEMAQIKIFRCIPTWKCSHYSDGHRMSSQLWIGSRWLDRWWQVHENNDDEENENFSDDEEEEINLGLEKRRRIAEEFEVWN